MHRERERRLPLKLVRALDRGLFVIACGLLVSTGLAAMLDTSQAWDVWYYHLPFAARLAGIVGENDYVLSTMNRARFAGFPLGAEMLQGALWRITGRPESANLVAFGAIPLFAWFVRRACGVAWHHVVLALFAIPLVQTHATSCYVDLPANACAAGLVLLVARTWSMPAHDVTRATWLGVVAFATGAAHMRFQLAPIVALALLAAFVRAPAPSKLALAASSVLVFFWPLKNLFVHHNPVYPVELRIGRFVLPGADTPYASSPQWLEHVPRPVRFAASVLELGARPLSDAGRWSVDQWTPPDHDGYRMGGFFGAYVVALLVVWWLARRAAKDPFAKKRAAAFALLTVVVAFLPQSHELRYYLVWMLVLVASALTAVPERFRVGAAFMCLTFTAVVITVTRGVYVRPSGDGFGALVARRVDAASLAGVAPGARICVARPPWNFLYAARFHAPARYVVVEADEPAECPAP